MSETHALSADDCEILITRELRRAGIEPAALRRTMSRFTQPADGWYFERAGTFEVYDRRFSALVACRNVPTPLSARDVDGVRARADAAHMRSALLFATGSIEQAAIERAHDVRIALFAIVAAQPVMLAAGLLQPGPLPAWLPGYTVELVTHREGRDERRLLQADEPELILRELRRKQ